VFPEDAAAGGGAGGAQRTQQQGVEVQEGHARQGRAARPRRARGRGGGRGRGDEHGEEQGIMARAAGWANRHKASLPSSAAAAMPPTKGQWGRGAATVPGPASRGWGDVEQIAGGAPCNINGIF